MHQKKRDLFRTAIVFQLTRFQLLTRFKSVHGTQCRYPVMHQRVIVERLDTVQVAQISFIDLGSDRNRWCDA